MHEEEKCSQINALLPIKTSVTCNSPTNIVVEEPERSALLNTKVCHYT